MSPDSTARPAFVTDYQRMWDLVRYARGYLSDAGLISTEEYAALVAAETSAPGQGSPSARRLESYDKLRAELDRLRAALARCEGLVDKWEADLSMYPEHADERAHYAAAAVRACRLELASALVTRERPGGE